jgi:predicted amidohydrolase YtcJ
MQIRPLLALCGALLPTPVLHAQSPSVSLIIVNARVWTGSRTRPWADAVAVRGDRLAVVGTSAEAMKLATADTRVIDAKGRMVTPGFLDSHVHFVDGGYDLTSVQLRDATSPADLIARVKAFATTLPPGAWMLGGTWDHTRWGTDNALPTRTWIDSVTPRTPVWVQRLDGHMGLANSAALAAAHITRDTPDVPGGAIVRDATGEPTGILKDNAMGLVERAIPTPPLELQDRALDAAMAYANAQGVTAVTNMGAQWDDWATFARAHAAGRLTTRIYSVVPLRDWARLRDTIAARGRGDAWLHWGGLKGFADGSLGSHTAAMLTPFTDAPHDSGLLVTPPALLYTWAEAADRAGLQVMVHAIGDRAIRNMLDIYERIDREDGKRDRRFRIEHAQHIAASDVARFGQLGVIASMQPYHAIDDGRWADPIIGPERAKTTYAFRSLLDTHATIAFGSDWDVAPATPIEGIYAAVTRRTLDDKHPDGWVPAQKITVDEALHAYTTTAAYTAFAERDLGVLAVGRLADLVLIDRDLTRIPPETIRDAHVDMTVVGGRVVYERK